jgi:NhaP-type Na+/H+ or K+/H+ antiporter
MQLTVSLSQLRWNRRKCLSQVIILATVGVLIGQGLVAGFCYYVFPYDWDWKFSLLIGAILAATDPVAVVALLKELGASKKLGTIIEGESLMNDGTAIVMFLLFLDLAKGGTKTTGEVIVFFIQVPFAGIAIGLAAGIMTLLCIRWVYNDAAVTISLTLTACYLAFFVAEEVAHSSGVLAVVTLGVFLGALGKPYFQVRNNVP